MIQENRAYKYAKSVVEGTLKRFDGKVIIPPRYVVKQCEEFLTIANGKDDKWKISEFKVRQIESILKLLKMPKGLKAGKTLYNCASDYQWLFIIGVLCTVSRIEENKRRYETAILEIARKNFKTYTIAIIFIILFLTEPQFSKFYSVAPDGSLSREVKEAIEETIKASPSVYGSGKVERFKILRDYIKFIPSEIKYTPLNYTKSRFDGKLPSAFIADEVGALPTSYAIDAMRSGQLNVLNKLGCIISTKYPTMNNPFEEEVMYAKKVLDGSVEDSKVFALLYEPDDTKEWMTDDEILEQANPAAIESKELWEDLLSKRQRAIEVESSRENFVTKHCNIIYQGVGTETYIPVSDVVECRADHINWEGMTVYIGVDLAMSNDNCAVSMLGQLDGKIYCMPMAFIPEGRINEKIKSEKFDYDLAIKRGQCIPCGDRIVDYGVIEDYVFDLEEKYNVIVAGIVFDRYNAMSSAQRWERGRNEHDGGYETIEVKPHSSVLHSPTKLLAELITEKNFRYMKNELFETNFENARCTYDTNMNRFVNKKKSNGKIDMVMATINAVYLLQQNELAGEVSWVSQSI